MASILDTIILSKQEEVKRLKKERSRFTGRSSDVRGFAKAIRQEGSLSIIAEIKKASPSKGIIRADFDPIRIAATYQEGGASALSVLTDEKFFMGTEKYLVDARGEVSLPVLRKDFIIDPIQVEQTASMNADAMLLIAACLSDSQMDELSCAARELDLDILLEIRNRKELDRVLKLSVLPPCIGINNRDLGTFVTSLATTFEIAPHVPKEITLVSESGIHSAKDAKELFAAGVAALLVGEYLMRSDDAGSLIKALRDVN